MPGYIRRPNPAVIDEHYRNLTDSQRATVDLMMAEADGVVSEEILEFVLEASEANELEVLRPEPGRADSAP